jgi:hypothetical protein
MIDIPKLKRDLLDAARTCSELKRRLRRRWTEPMGDVQRALLRARRRATELNILRAHLRGRQHLTRPPRDGTAASGWDAAAHHSQVAARVAAEYVLPDSVIAREAS